MPLIFEHLTDWKQMTASAGDDEASELHGLISGLLSGAPGRSATDLVAALEPLGEWRWTARIRDTLAAGALQTAGGLDSEDFSFAPLLPDDDSALEHRASCLGAWCGGFIAGYGAAVGNAQGNEEQQEVLRDLQQIALAAMNEEDGQDIQEDAYMRLVEYVRTVAMLLRQSALNQQAGSPS
ncbi:MAG: UPF0149 family protein [Wenzhouxiangellaceae bacterium]